MALVKNDSGYNKFYKTEDDIREFVDTFIEKVKTISEVVRKRLYCQ